MLHKPGVGPLLLFLCKQNGREWWPENADISFACSSGGQEKQPLERGPR